MHFLQISSSIWDVFITKRSKVSHVHLFKVRYGLHELVFLHFSSALAFGLTRHVYKMSGPYASATFQNLSGVTHECVLDTHTKFTSRHLCDWIIYHVL